MAIRRIPLTKERDLPPDGSIIFPIRADLPDYGNPGAHLGGPWAIPGKGRAAQLGIGRPGETIEVGGLLGCMPLGGEAFTSSRMNTSGQTRVFASQQIPVGFIINHVFVVTDAALTGDVRFHLKVADDNDTSGGVDTSGTHLFGRRGEQLYITVSATVENIYPNWLVREPNKFLKVIIVNNDAVSRQTVYSIEWVYQT